MQQLKTFINKTFAHHIISQKDNDIIVNFKREDGTVQDIYAQVFKLKTGEYVFNLVGACMGNVIANTSDFAEFKKKVKGWAIYV